MSCYVPQVIYTHIHIHIYEYDEIRGFLIESHLPEITGHAIVCVDIYILDVISRHSLYSIFPLVTHENVTSIKLPPVVVIKSVDVQLILLVGHAIVQRFALSSSSWSFLWIHKQCYNKHMQETCTLHNEACKICKCTKFPL